MDFHILNLTVGSDIAICGADIPPILAIKEHIPTPDDLQYIFLNQGFITHFLSLYFFMF